MLISLVVLINMLSYSRSYLQGLYYHHSGWLFEGGGEGGEGVFGCTGWEMVGVGLTVGIV